ncbi:MAG: DASS family sodium-coupled anion symporter [Candidatus Solibacter usitatus]|nr:DASS family sodium-coupled anion symporter [Candidatus Solibacter usitatus]
MTRTQAWKWAVLIAVYCIIVYLVPKPAEVKPEGWRMLGIFMATIGGLVLEPIPGTACVLLGITASMILGGLTPSSALTGFADPSVWLVVAAYMISRALINTGLARRIALFFVRLFGGTSLGVCYSLSFSDAVLAAVIPSNGARSGGVVMPIMQSICELYGSKAGPTASLLGTFLFAALYQNICLSSAMFFTGQASNPLAADFANKAGLNITWVSWLVAGSVPGICAILICPLVVRRLVPLVIDKTPEAPKFAHSELQKMGATTLHEKILTMVFAGVCFGWVTGELTGIHITVTALSGCAVLLLCGVLKWEDVKAEKSLWDLFVWYGGLVKLGRSLNESGVAQSFANNVANWFPGAGWVLLFTVSLLIYFYAHYAFASITGHILAMYPAFLAILSAKGAPLGLTGYAFATFVNFSAGLTNYGTTPAPMFFERNYVSMKDWWKVGAVISVVNLTVWSTVGFVWWKVLGIW